MNYWERLRRALHAARTSWDHPEAPKAAPLPAAFNRPPTAPVIIPAAVSNRVKLWRVAAPDQYFIYEAFSPYAELLVGGGRVGNDWARSSAKHIIRRRSQARMHINGVGDLRLVCPLAGQLYWWWRQQEGTLGKQTFDHAHFILFLIDEEPVLVAQTFLDGMTAFSRADPARNGQRHHYITRLTLPQPLLTLKQTIRVTPALASSLKTMLVEDAQ